MTIGPIESRRVRMVWMLVGIVSVLLLELAGPALAKQHHAHKPYKLWHQYPLRVKSHADRIKTGRPSPSPKPAVIATPHRVVRSHPGSSSSTNLGLWLALAGGIGLVIIGGFALKRQRPATGGGLLPPRSEPDLVPSEPTPPPAEPEVAIGASLHAPAEEEPRAPRGSHPPAEPELGSAATSASVGRPARDSVHPPAEPELEPAQNSNGPIPARAAAPAPPAPETPPAPEHVRLQLADGRLLEGYRRNSPSTSPHLIILDILAAFDPEGNVAPTRPSDSFILESEISSIQRIDDP
jgi:hypothetical protein